MIDPFDAVLNAPKMARVVTLTFSHDTYVMPVVTRSRAGRVNTLGQAALMVYLNWLTTTHRAWLRLAGFVCLMLTPRNKYRHYIRIMRKC